MQPTRAREPANAPTGILYRQPGRDRRTPAARQVGHRNTGTSSPATDFAPRVRTPPGSITFRQLAGPAAVFLLWPPGPQNRQGRYQQPPPAKAFKQGKRFWSWH
jgi:hypothetical protein